MFDRVLIANRGAIACRIQRTLHRLGIASIAVYSDADTHAPHVRAATAAVRLGPAPAAESYLQQERIIRAARDSGAQAIHPGYGFLSENAAFAEACEAAGIAFIGPTPRQMRDFGLKHAARALAAAHGLPMLPGTPLLPDLEAALVAADAIGYPVMLKSTAGGGGIGMQQCADARELSRAFAAVQRLAANNFRDSGVFLERYIARARHIEVQIFGDGAGTVVAIGDRDCSLQRRNQKVIEEAPAPNLPAAVRTRLHEMARALGAAVNYRSAGTVEFVHDADRGESYFLEVNTRLQVEHGVTEEIAGIDLVEWMVRTAAGEPPDLAAFRYVPRGHAVQARIYAEDPARAFRPASGLLTEVNLAPAVRVDGWIESGTEVTGYYDPLLAKMIAHAPDRETAIGRLDAALAASVIHGIETNLPWLRTVLAIPEFMAGVPTTRRLDTHHPVLPSIEVIEPGTQSTLQDWPGRAGAWDVGVPPSGPMDALALRVGNRLVGNDEGAAAIEMTASGATLHFNHAARIALTGARMAASLQGNDVPWWEAFEVAAGATLVLGEVEGAGQRTYLAVAGSFDLPAYLGSRSTFTLGRFGGHGGRALRSGDVLRTRPPVDSAAAAPAGRLNPPPSYAHDWRIGVIDGPHGAPDFFTRADIDAFYAAEWEVHYNSSRTGVRLIGPKPRWARQDGGEAGLHPSNIHDNAYAVGSIDYTGDMPVILGPDGPSLGGFVCPATVVLPEMWKLGQLRAGDRVRFERWSVEQATAALDLQDVGIAATGALAPFDQPTRGEGVYGAAALAGNAAPTFIDGGAAGAGVIHTDAASASRPAVVIRQAGEDNLLVEFGPLELDLSLRFQVQALLESLNAARIDGVLELTPGIRSLQVHFDARRIPQQRVLACLRERIDTLADIESMVLPSRIVHLPLSWDDPAVRLATERYSQSVRADAPWCPDNIEFIRRINGLDSAADVRRIVFDASYLVMGLGDVYLGAPVATPLDPRHRLVTTKYNPARTWTPENAVGIGGAYLCVYGMEGPGGYQFVGRTLQMWNRFQPPSSFADGKPWLLRFFDQIRFFPVSADELLDIRARFPWGGYPLRIEHTTLRLADYRAFLAQHATEITSFRTRQQQAFAAERARWREAGLVEAPPVEAVPTPAQNALPAGCVAVRAPVSGSVWQMKTAAGQRVRAGEELLVMESMKMEIGVKSGVAGEVAVVYCAAGRPAAAGELLMAVRPGVA